jgi:ABC-type amino acid transport substrate-binding protein
MNLSDPYMKNEMIFVVPGSSDAKVMSDLRGRSVGVQAGSTAEELLEASELYANVTAVLYETNQALLEDLAQGGIDAALVDSVAAYYFIFSSSSAFFILPESLGEEDYAIAFRKGDQTLRDKVQEIIGEMKADGTLASISKKWFGSDITTVR